MNRDAIIQWINRMANERGGIVRDKEANRTWDWGQAICRELYGPRWFENASFIIHDERDEIPSETWDAMRRLERRECEWVEQPEKAIEPERIGR